MDNNSLENNSLEDTICFMFENNIIKYNPTGFVLKSGLTSKLYIDLRTAMSFPKLVKDISNRLWDIIPDEITKQADLICGVPYGALQYATLLSIDHNIPMIMRRKEKKEYGTGKMIEGNFKSGQKVIVVEDTITTGSSTMELINELIKYGLEILCVVVFFNHQRYETFKYPIYYTINVKTVKTMLIDHGFMPLSSDEELKEIIDSLASVIKPSLNRNSLVKNFEQHEKITKTQQKLYFARSGETWNSDVILRNKNGVEENISLKGFIKAGNQIDAFNKLNERVSFQILNYQDANKIMEFKTTDGALNILLDYINNHSPVKIFLAQIDEI